MRKEHKFKGSTYIENVPDSVIEIKSAQNAQNTETFPKFVTIRQEDYNDEYFGQQICVVKEDAEKIIAFLKDQFDL